MTFQRRWAKTQSASVYSHEHRDVEMAAPNIIPAPPPPQAHPPPPPPPPPPPAQVPFPLFCLLMPSTWRRGRSLLATKLD